MENEEQQKQVNKKKSAKAVVLQILNILSWVLLGFTALVMVFTIVSTSTFNKDGKEIFGVSMRIVLSDSMKKTDFAAGDLIFIQKVDPNTLKEGDIICFTTVKDGKEEVITHKILRKTTVKEQIKNPDTGVYEDYYYPAFKTYGTTSGKEDAEPVLYGAIKGKYVGKIPYAGYVFQFLKTPAGYVCIVLVPFALVIGYMLFTLISNIVQYRRENVSVYRSEKQGLVEERKNLQQEREENLRMLEEMRRLKEELAALKTADVPPSPPKEDVPPPPQEDIFEGKEAASEDTQDQNN
jgi:signal peptidase